MQAIIDSKIMNNIKTLDLTGGFDTRTCFAALLLIDNGLHNVQFVTICEQEKDIRDVAITSGLVNMFGGTFYKLDPDAIERLLINSVEPVKKRTTIGLK